MPNKKRSQLRTGSRGDLFKSAVPDIISTHMRHTSPAKSSSRISNLAGYYSNYASRVHCAPPKTSSHRNTTKERQSRQKCGRSYVRASPASILSSRSRTARLELFDEKQNRVRALSRQVNCRWIEH